MVVTLRRLVNPVVCVCEHDRHGSRKILAMLLAALQDPTLIPQLLDGLAGCGPSSCCFKDLDGRWQRTMSSVTGSGGTQTSGECCRNRRELRRTQIL